MNAVGGEQERAQFHSFVLDKAMKEEEVAMRKRLVGIIATLAQKTIGRFLGSSWACSFDSFVLFRPGYLKAEVVRGSQVHRSLWYIQHSDFASVSHVLA